MTLEESFGIYMMELMKWVYFEMVKHIAGMQHETGRFRSRVVMYDVLISLLKLYILSLLMSFFVLCKIDIF